MPLKRIKLNIYRVALHAKAHGMQRAQVHVCRHQVKQNLRFEQQHQKGYATSRSIHRESVAGGTDFNDDLLLREQFGSFIDFYC